MVLCIACLYEVLFPSFFLLSPFSLQLLALYVTLVQLLNCSYFSQWILPFSDSPPHHTRAGGVRELLRGTQLPAGDKPWQRGRNAARAYFSSQKLVKEDSECSITHFQKTKHFLPCLYFYRGHIHQGCRKFMLFRNNSKSCESAEKQPLSCSSYQSIPWTILFPETTHHLEE